MNNEELKKKIMDVIYATDISVVLRRDDIIILADALIEAGLCFGENLTATFDHMALEREHKLERRLAESEHRAEVAELVVKNLNDIFTFDYQTVFEQAEKELAEEGEDG